MSSRIVAAVVLACSVLVSCTVSEKAPRKVLKAEGEAVRIELFDQRKLSGELLCVSDTHLFFMDLRIKRVPLANVKSVKVEGYGAFDAKDLRGGLEPYSRYPKGLSEEQWRTLLDHYGQQEIAEPAGP